MLVKEKCQKIENRSDKDTESNVSKGEGQDKEKFRGNF